jgi:hypothetical protein
MENPLYEHAEWLTTALNNPEERYNYKLFNNNNNFIELHTCKFDYFFYKRTKYQIVLGNVILDNYTIIDREETAIYKFIIIPSINVVGKPTTPSLRQTL